MRYLLDVNAVIATLNEPNGPLSSRLHSLVPADVGRGRSPCGRDSRLIGRPGHSHGRLRHPHRRADPGAWPDPRNLQPARIRTYPRTELGKLVLRAIRLTYSSHLPIQNRENTRASTA